VVYPIIYRVSTIQGGAGFLPSTVGIEYDLIWLNLSNKRMFLGFSGDLM